MDEAEEEYYMNERSIAVIEQKIEDIEKQTKNGNKNGKKGKATEYEEPFPFDTPTSTTGKKNAKNLPTKTGPAVYGTVYRDLQAELLKLRQKSTQLEEQITELDGIHKQLLDQKRANREEKDRIEVPVTFKWDSDVNISTFGGETDILLNPNKNPNFLGGVYPAIKARLHLLDTAARAQINNKRNKEQDDCCTDNGCCDENRTCEMKDNNDENDESDDEKFQISDADLELAALEGLSNAVMEETLDNDLPKENPNLQDEFDIQILGLHQNPITNFEKSSEKSSSKCCGQKSCEPAKEICSEKLSKCCGQKSCEPAKDICSKKQQPQDDPDVGYPNDLSLFRNKTIEQLYGMITEFYNQKQSMKAQVEYHQLVTFLRSGCNLMISHPQRFSTKIWRLLWLLESQFRTLVDSHIQVIPKHSMGTAKRYSDNGCFVLQLSGTTNFHLYQMSLPQSAFSVPNLVELINETNQTDKGEHFAGVHGPFYQHESINAMSSQIPSSTHSLKQGDFLYFPPHSVHQVVPTLEPTLVYSGDVDEFNQLQIQDAMEEKRAHAKEISDETYKKMNQKLSKIGQFLPPTQTEDSIYLVITFPQQAKFQKLYHDAFTAAFEEVLNQNPQFSRPLPPHFSTYLGTIHDSEIDAEGNDQAGEQFDESMAGGFGGSFEDDDGPDDVEEEMFKKNGKNGKTLSKMDLSSLDIQDLDPSEMIKGGKKLSKSASASGKNNKSKFGDIELDEDEMAEFEAFKAKQSKSKSKSKPSTQTNKTTASKSNAQAEESDEYRYSDLSDDLPSDDEGYMGKMSTDDNDDDDFAFDLSQEIPPYVMSDNFPHLHRKWLMVGNINPEYRTILKQFRQTQINDLTQQIFFNLQGRISSHIHQAADKLSVEFNQQRLPPPPVEDDDGDDDDEDGEDEDFEFGQDGDESDGDNISLEELEAMEAMNPVSDSESEGETATTSKKSAKSNNLRTKQSPMGDQDEDAEEDGEDEDDEEVSGYNPKKALKLEMNSQNQIVSTRSTLLASTLGAINRRELEMQYLNKGQVTSIIENVLSQLDNDSGVRIAFLENLHFSVEQSQAQIADEANDDEDDQHHPDYLLEMENDEDGEDFEDEDEEDFDEVSPPHILQKQQGKLSKLLAPSSSSKKSSTMGSEDDEDMEEDEDGRLPGEELFPEICSCGGYCDAYQLYCSQLSRAVSLPHSSKCIAIYNSDNNNREKHLKFYETPSAGDYISPIAHLFESDAEEDAKGFEDEDGFDDEDGYDEDDEDDEEMMIQEQMKKMAQQKPSKTNPTLQSTSKFAKFGGKKSFQSTNMDDDSEDEEEEDSQGLETCAPGGCCGSDSCAPGGCGSAGSDPGSSDENDEDGSDESGRTELPIAILPMIRMLQEEYPRLLPIADLQLDWKAVRNTSSGFVTQMPLELIHKLNEYSPKIDQLFGSDSEQDEDNDEDNQDDNLSSIPSARLAMLYKFWAICELFSLGFIEIVPSDTYDINAMLADEGPDADGDGDGDDELFDNDDEDFEEDQGSEDEAMIELLNQKNQKFGKVHKNVKNAQNPLKNLLAAPKKKPIQVESEEEDEVDFDFDEDQEGFEGEFDGFEGEFDGFEGEFDDFDFDEDLDEDFDDRFGGCDTSDDEALTPEERIISDNLKNQLKKSALQRAQGKVDKNASKTAKSTKITPKLTAQQRLKAQQLNKYGASDSDSDADDSDQMDSWMLGEGEDGEGELGLDELMRMYGGYDGEGENTMLDTLDLEDVEGMDLGDFDFGQMTTQKGKKQLRTGMNSQSTDDDDEDDDEDVEWDSDDDGAADGAMIWEESGSDYGEEDSDFDDLFASEGDVEEQYWKNLDKLDNLQGSDNSDDADVWDSDSEDDIPLDVWGSDDEVQLPPPKKNNVKKPIPWNKTGTGFKVEVLNDKKDNKKDNKDTKTEPTKDTKTTQNNKILSKNPNPSKRKALGTAEQDDNIQHVSKKANNNTTLQAKPQPKTATAKNTTPNKNTNKKK